MKNENLIPNLLVKDNTPSKRGGNYVSIEEQERKENEKIINELQKENEKNRKKDEKIINELELTLRNIRTGCDCDFYM